MVADSVEKFRPRQYTLGAVAFREAHIGQPDASWSVNCDGDSGAKRASEDIALTTLKEPAMTKLAAFLVAAMFALGSTSALAAKHAAAEKDAKKPSAEECKKDPKMKGCEEPKKDKK